LELCLANWDGGSIMLAKFDLFRKAKVRHVVTPSSLIETIVKPILMSTC
jgi:hypothetical protein